MLHEEKGQEDQSFSLQSRGAEAIKESVLQRQLCARNEQGEYLGGIVAEEIEEIDGTKHTLLHIGNPYEKNPSIITLQTRATKSEIEEIKAGIIPTEEASRILSSLAMSYTLRLPLLIEGPTSLGKTFLIGKFTELLYGKGVEPLRFYCSGQTDVSELLARWVPKTDNAHDPDRWNQYLRSEEGAAELQKLNALMEQNGSTQSQLRLLTEMGRRAGVAGGSQWELQWGAIPRAMQGEIDSQGEFYLPEQGGRGFILDIEEIGLAKPQVINALLRLRGVQGEVATGIQLWEFGGQKVTAGPDYWFVMTTNPPEEYLDRNEIDPALARGAVYLRLEDMSRESFNLAARRYFTYGVGNRPTSTPNRCLIQLYNYPEIGSELAEIIGTFHKEFSDATRFGEPGRQQRIPVTLDDLAKTAKHVLHFQVRSPETGLADLPETIRRAVRFAYLDRLADKKLKAKMTEALELTLTGDIGKREFDGVLRTRKEILDGLVKGAAQAEAKSLVISESEREKLNEELKLKQARFDAQDKLLRLQERVAASKEIHPILKEEILKLRIDPPSNP